MKIRKRMGVRGVYMRENDLMSGVWVRVQSNIYTHVYHGDALKF